VARVFWFRRDRRLQDNVALNSCAKAAIADGDKTVVPAFWFDHADYEALSGLRQHSVTESLKALDESMDSCLQVVASTDMSGLVEFAVANKASFIHATESFDPEGIAEQRSLAAKLKGTGIELVLEDSYYAVKPGTVAKPTDGTAYRVYTPFYKSWFQIGWSAPVKLVKGFEWKSRSGKSNIPKPTKSAPFKVKAGEAFALECAAMKRVREDMGLTNVEIMVPFVRTIKQAERVIDMMAKFGLKRGENGLRLIMMCEIPSNAILADQFLEYFDGFSIGSNDMTQLTLGLDRDSGMELLAIDFDERDPAVQFMIERSIDACLKQNKYVGICGQGPSDHPDFARWLVKKGITSISLNPDSVVGTWEMLAKSDLS
jgi:hypothetical protein